AATFFPEAEYHTVIAQDGHDYFRLGRIGRQAEELMSKEEIDRCIIIGVPYKSVRERRNTYHPEGSKYASYNRFIANELVPLIDKEYL
ncbi:alpha/beta hydrolase-fold protein, partial [Bacillus cereus]|uniref:alpha/beta hydrolase-fold protein n=1 Tax=Bacillus cereus TaxID=1396 RepID=UPI0020BFEEE3